MKNTIKILTALVKISSFAIGLTAYQQMLPPQYLPFAIMFFAGASAVKEIGLIICDYLDDGIRNNSYTLPCLAACLFLLPFLTSCSLSKEQWAKIGQNIVSRETPIVFSEIQAASTSAKQPIKPIQP